MHTEIVRIIKENPYLAGLLERVPSSGIYNIFPKHVPSGAMDNNFTKAIVYNIYDSQIEYKSTLYRIQLSVFSKDYDENRTMALELKKLFNNKAFTDEDVGIISSIVENMVELQFDTDTGMFGTAVNIQVKTDKDI